MDRIRELGWEEAYLLWAERFPHRINVNAAVGMVAAEKGVSWLAVGEEDKRAARRVVDKLRRRLAARDPRNRE